MKHLSGYISVLHRYALQYYSGRETETGIRGVQYPYLFYICRHEGCCQDDLVEHLHVNKSNVTRQLDKLVQSGMIEIRSDEKDGRIKRVYPTAAALKSREKVCTVLDDWNEYMCEALEPQEQEQLHQLLNRVLLSVRERDHK